jgi:GT2 family glycosyltransferase
VEPFEGYNKSLNNGFKKANCDIVVFCNNDLIFKSGWFEPLKNGLKNFDSVSPWCPLTHWQWWKDIPSGVQLGYQVGKHIAGWCISANRKTIESIGGFDERLEFWCCDNAYSEQLKAKGLSHALITKSHVAHLQSQTLNKVDKVKYRELTNNQIKVFNRLYKKNLFNVGI